MKCIILNLKKNKNVVLLFFRALGKIMKNRKNVGEILKVSLFLK